MPGVTFPFSQLGAGRTVLWVGHPCCCFHGCFKETFVSES